MRCLVLFSLGLFCFTQLPAQSLVAFQQLERCPDWLCVVSLVRTPSLRLDRSIPWRLPLYRHARLSSGYGYRTHPIVGTRKFHDGVDIAAPLGSAVLSAGSGRIATGFHATLGNYVTIDHLNGFFSTYGHLDSICVLSGQLVAAGHVIGDVGISGQTTGPHLHWSVRFAGSGSLDPLEVRRLLLDQF